MLVSAVQQSESAVCIQTYPLFRISFPLKAPQSVPSIVYIHQSWSPNSSHPPCASDLEVWFYPKCQDKVKRAQKSNILTPRWSTLTQRVQRSVDWAQNEQIDVLWVEIILFYFILSLNFCFDPNYMKNHSHLDSFPLKDQSLQWWEQKVLCWETGLKWKERLMRHCLHDLDCVKHFQKPSPVI